MQTVTRRILDSYQTRATARDAIMANKERIGQKLLGIQAFTYVAPFAGVAASTNTTYNLQLQGNTDFIICYLSGAVFNSTTQANISNPFARLQINDNISQLPMFSIPQYFSLATGNSGFPFILQDGRLLGPTTILQVTFYNDMSVGPITADAQVAFGGYRAIYA